MNLMTVEHIRKTTNAKLNPKKKSELGQFMTPSVIAEYMASLFDDHKKEIKLLDCGAGIGSLTISAAKKLKNINFIEEYLYPSNENMGETENHVDISYKLKSTEFYYSILKDYIK